MSHSTVQEVWLWAGGKELGEASLISQCFEQKQLHSASAESDSGNKKTCLKFKVNGV